MRSSAAGSQREYVIRDAGTAAIFWVAAALLIVVAGATVLGGDWRFLLIMVPFALFAAWAVWLVLFHPHVRYDSIRALVVNIGRIHELPWARVSAVRQRLGIVFELSSGSIITAAGASAPRGMGTIASGITGRMRDDSDFNRRAEPLDAMRASAAPTNAQVVSRWDTVPLTVGAALFVVAAIDLVIGIAGGWALNA